MIEWEYKTVDEGDSSSNFKNAWKAMKGKDFLGEALTSLGKEGWELVCAVPIRSILLGGDKFKQRYIFKRVVVR